MLVAAATAGRRWQAWDVVGVYDKQSRSEIVHVDDHLYWACWRKKVSASPLLLSCGLCGDMMVVVIITIRPQDVPGFWITRACEYEIPSAERKSKHYWQ